VLTYLKFFFKTSETQSVEFVPGCSPIKRNGPLNISDPLHYKNFEVDLKWIDKGRIQFSLNSEGNIISNNDFGYIIYTEFPGTDEENTSVYDAYKIKFVRHSENLFSDKQLPVELQIFSLNKSGKELILSAMFEAFNDSNYGMEKLNVIGGRPGMTTALYAAQKDGQPNRSIIGGGQFVFNMNTLLGPTKNWLQYQGSSSSIPMECKEATWLVLYELLPMSPGQIKHFRPPTSPMIAKNPQPGQFIYQNVSKNSDGVTLPPPLRAGNLSAMYLNLIVGVKTPVLTWIPTPVNKPLPKDALTKTEISAGKNLARAAKGKKPAKAKTVKLLAENIDLENEPSSMNRNLAEKNSSP
jgi:carbonic anhydrase